MSLSSRFEEARAYMTQNERAYLEGVFALPDSPGRNKGIDALLQQAEKAKNAASEKLKEAEKRQELIRRFEEARPHMDQVFIGYVEQVLSIKDPTATNNAFIESTLQRAEELKNTNAASEKSKKESEKFESLREAESRESRIKDVEIISQKTPAEDRRTTAEKPSSACDLILLASMVAAVVGACLLAATFVLGWGVPALALSAVVLAGGLIVAGARVVINCFANQESSAG